MKTVLFTVSLLTAVCLVAQTSSEASVQANALKMRSDLVDAIMQGGQTLEAAIGQLRAAPSPAGLQIDPDAGFSLAAIDIGQRLIAARNPEMAERFFAEAEKSLEKALEKTPDKAAKDKAELFEHRAFIRANFLNKTPEADADLEKAIALLPDDKRLQQKRDSLPAVKAGRKEKQIKTN